MISKQNIINLINQHVLETNLYLVHLEISASSKIVIKIDSENKITIKDCIALSRHIESNLDRERQDFELEVSSPGATEPFKVLNQYKSHIGKNVIIKQINEQILQGKLLQVSNEFLEIETTERIKKEIGKGYQQKIATINLPFNQIKETKSVLPF